jgi:hypothetical protein
MYGYAYPWRTFITTSIDISKGRRDGIPERFVQAWTHGTGLPWSGHPWSPVYAVCDLLEQSPCIISQPAYPRVSRYALQVRLSVLRGNHGLEWPYSLWDALNQVRWDGVIGIPTTDLNAEVTKYVVSEHETNEHIYKPKFVANSVPRDIGFIRYLLLQNIPIGFGIVITMEGLERCEERGGLSYEVSLMGDPVDGLAGVLVGYDMVEGVFLARVNTEQYGLTGTLLKIPFATICDYRTCGECVILTSPIIN